MSSISKEPQFIIDSNERISKEPLRVLFPSALEERLEVCDLVEIYPPEDVPDKEYNGWGLEIKINHDVDGIVQLSDEMTRCNYPKYNNYELHAVYISPTPNFDSYNLFVSKCVHANVIPHHVYWLELPPNLDKEQIKQLPYYTSTLRNLIMKIRRGSYRKPLQQHKHASQHADYRVRVVAELPDISEATALEMVDDVMKLLETGVGILMQEYPELFRSLIDKILAHLPKNKDGTPSQKQADLYEILVNWGKEP